MYIMIYEMIYHKVALLSNVYIKFKKFRKQLLRFYMERVILIVFGLFEKIKIKDIFLILGFWTFNFLTV